MKTDKIVYWITTGLVSAMMLFSAFMYLSRDPQVMAGFKILGLPLFFINILAVAKILGAIALLAPVGARIKEWAYAGFLFVFIGAIWAHIASSTPFIMPAVFLAVLGVSYLFWNKLKLKTA